MTARDKKKESMWRRHVQAHGRGGLSVRAYCTARGLREYSFYWWRRELARRDGEKFPPVEVAQPAFVPVRVTAARMPSPAGAVEIVLPGDRLVRVTGPVDLQQLVDVLAALEGHAQRQGNESC